MDPWQAKIKDFQDDLKQKLQLLQGYIQSPEIAGSKEKGKEAPPSPQKNLLEQQEKAMIVLLEILEKRAEIAYPKPKPAPETKPAETVPHKK